MTVSQKWKCAALAAVTVPALTVVACSVPGDGGDPAPTDTSGAAVSQEAEETDSAEGAGGMAEFVSARLPDAVGDGAPDGVELSEPGTTLSFGEAGYVVTGTVDAPRYWKVTAKEPEKIGADEVPLTDDANDDVDTFVCLTYTVTLLEAEDAAEPPENPDPPTAPELVPVDDKAHEANRVVHGGNEQCGVDGEDTLPAEPADVEPDTGYTRAVLSYVDKDPRRGISPTGMAFTYDLDGAVEDRGENDPVVWD